MSARVARFLALSVAVPLALLPFRIQEFLARLAAAVLRLSLPRRIAIARRNLAIAFPELEPSERERLLDRHFRHLGRLVVDTLQQPAFRFRSLLWQKVHPVGWGHLEDALRKGPSAILLCAHLGSWEIGAAVATLPGVRLLSVYKPSRRGFADAFVAALREGLPQVLLPKQDALRPLVQGARSGALLGLIADQGGLEEYTFFGRPARFPEGPGHFAARFGSLPVPCFSIRRDDGSYDCHCLPPLSLPEGRGREAKRRVMTEYVALLETWIRRHPEQYYWVHDIWRSFKDDAPPPGSGAEGPEGSPDPGTGTAA